MLPGRFFDLPGAVETGEVVMQSGLHQEELETQKHVKKSSGNVRKDFVCYQKHEKKHGVICVHSHLKVEMACHVGRPGAERAWG